MIPRNNNPSTGPSRQPRRKQARREVGTRAREVLLLASLFRPAPARRALTSSVHSQPNSWHHRHVAGLFRAERTSNNEQKRDKQATSPRLVQITSAICHCPATPEATARRNRCTASRLPASRIPRPDLGDTPTSIFHLPSACDPCAPHASRQSSPTPSQSEPRFAFVHLPVPPSAGIPLLSVR